jgi:hypothetical protein
MFVAGTTLVVSQAQCSTDTNGYVVGVGNPVSGPRVAAQYVGTLPAGNYYVKFTWYDQFNAQTLPSVEVAQQLSSAGELQISPPVGAGPAGAVGMEVYIGTAPGAETYQGKTGSPTAVYTQAVALVTGANPPPISNQTACRVVANDAAWPTGTGYQASLVDASGNTLFNYTELWQFYGPGSTYNLSNGIPYYHGQVTYPVPVLTIPYNHNPQSISGPLSLTSYNLYNVGALGVGTGLPAWGVDVEGTGNDSEINAIGGYLVNGAAGSSGQCLASNGTVFNTPVSCITSLPTLYYQTVQANGTPLTQEPVLNVLTPLTATTGSGQTALGVNTTGTETKVVTSAGAGTPGNCPEWDASGGLSDAHVPCATGTTQYVTFNGCAFANDGSGVQCNTTAAFGSAFADTSYSLVCTLYSSLAQTNSGAVPSVSFQPAITSTSAFTFYEETQTGSSTGWPISNSYGITVTCIGNHA